LSLASAVQHADKKDWQHLSWEQAFHDPIELPDGRQLRTLRDAGHYIQELPRAVQDRPEWQAAGKSGTAG
jgi:hypothetical protein